MSDYRVISRRRAALVAVVLLAVLAAFLVIATKWIDVYEQRISALQAESPHEAAAVLARDLELFAAAQALVLGAFAVFMIWHAVSAIRTRSMPPRGAWILEGQRVRTGRAAVRLAVVLIVLATLLAAASASMAVLVSGIAADLAQTGAA